ncbi:hypothetical protein BDV27DRAFT_158417 [Aspergillus caelatus]|uniref:Glucose-methanol-choline oxidoreductase N-terminal domain-containing protein n=1 Tax=Aspergillus caelatus TaxID=61420 RepID=A0A5N7A1Q8_9EURO|nr:uncharacterized protein BDV27DRAFT_158417 [Aspergillus caelatus]KAE8363801.1 hypothetical protein BDV27DRAFT_158417 [Aspergillus caelatus]
MAVTTNEVTLENVIRISQNENQYDFIIVGSGMGGGTLARMLVQEHGKSVLLIERGGIRFNTHCLNTARPHWHHEARSGPSQDNDIVYRAVKEQIPVAGGNSREYAGGPVYCLGGRSNV